MATLGKAYVHASATHPERVGRFPISHVFGQVATTHANAVSPTTRGGAYGVIGDDDFKVTTTTGLGWSCSAGRIICTGTSALAQGAYAGLNDAAVTGTLAARDATNPRITLIAYRVRDTDNDATGAEDDGIVMIDGPAAASPVDPTLTASLGSLVILSRVTVPSTANGGAPTFGDVRPFAAAIGGVMRVTSATRPTAGALYKGLQIHEVDTAARLWWDGTAWRYQYKPWASYTPAATTIPAIGTATFTNYFSVHNNRCFVTGEFIWASGASFGASLSTVGLRVPTGFSPAAGPIIPATGALQIIQAATGKFFPGASQINPGGPSIEWLNYGGHQSQTWQFSNTFPFPWVAGDVVRWSIDYPLA